MVTGAAAGLVGAFAAVAAGGTAATAGTPTAAASGPALGRLRLHNLSHVNDPAITPIFPGDPPFILETAATIPADGFYMQYVHENEHTGTHWGAPGHFQEGGLLADQLDAEDLFLPAVRIDVRAQSARDPDYAITVDDLRAFERRYGPIPPESAVIAWTGWDRRWGTPAYANLDADGVIHQPGFGPDAVRWLIRGGKLDRRGSLGTDTFGADRGVDETFEASVLLFERHRISLENLANLAALPPTGAYILVGGPINKNGSGSTATIWGLSS
jgi:kynurenine formamidase